MIKWNCSAGFGEVYENWVVGTLGLGYEAAGHLACSIAAVAVSLSRS